MASVDVHEHLTRISAAKQAAEELRVFAASCKHASLRDGSNAVVDEVLQLLRGLEDTALHPDCNMLPETIGSAALKAEDSLRVLQGKVATAARESKGNFFRMLVNPHKKIFKEARNGLADARAAVGLQEDSDSTVVLQPLRDLAAASSMPWLSVPLNLNTGDLPLNPAVGTAGAGPPTLMQQHQPPLPAGAALSSMGAGQSSPSSCLSPGRDLTTNASASSHRPSTHALGSGEGSTHGIVDSGGLEAGSSVQPGEGIKLHHSLSNSELVLKEVIGSGTEGKVYRGTWTNIDIAAKEYLAVEDCEVPAGQNPSKLAMQSALNALRKEVALLTSLKHPNLVRFCGVCLDPPLVVMEYYRHGSLFSMLDQARRQRSNLTANTQHSRQATKHMDYFDWDRRLAMLHDVAAGMMYLHKHQYVHGDLRSANLFLGQDGLVKIGDFGFSKRLSLNKASMQGKHITHPRWVAPELMTQNRLSTAADVYSYGIIMYEMLTWQMPFHYLSKEQVVLRVMSGGRPEIPNESELPPGTSSSTCLASYMTLMEECWDQDPDKRPGFGRIAARLQAMIRWRMIINNCRLQNSTMAALGGTQGSVITKAARAAAAAAAARRADGVLSGAATTAAAAAAAAAPAELDNKQDHDPLPRPAHRNTTPATEDGDLPLWLPEGRAAAPVIMSLSCQLSARVLEQKGPTAAAAAAAADDSHILDAGPFGVPEAATGLPLPTAVAAAGARPQRQLGGDEGFGDIPFASAASSGAAAAGNLDGPGLAATGAGTRRPLPGHRPAGSPWQMQQLQVGQMQQLPAGAAGSDVTVGWLQTMGLAAAVGPQHAASGQVQPDYMTGGQAPAVPDPVDWKRVSSSLLSSRTSSYRATAVPPASMQGSMGIPEQHKPIPGARPFVPPSENATIGAAAQGGPAMQGGLDQSHQAGRAASWEGAYQTIASLGSIAPGAELASCNSNSSSEHVLLLSLPRQQLQDLLQLQRLVQQSVLLRHPGVLRVRELRLTPLHLVVVLESCGFLSLSQYLQQLQQRGKQLSEVAARCLFQQVLLAVDYCHSQGLAGLPIQHTLLQERNGQPPLPKVPCPLFGLAHSSNSSNTAVQGRLRDIQACGQLLLQLLGGQLATTAISGGSGSQAVIHLPRGRSAACQELLQLLLGGSPAHMPCSVQGITSSSWFQQQQQDPALLKTQHDTDLEQQLCTQTQEQLDSIVAEVHAWPPGFVVCQQLADLAAAMPELLVQQQQSTACLGSSWCQVFEAKSQQPEQAVWVCCLPAYPPRDSMPEQQQEATPGQSLTLLQHPVVVWASKAEALSSKPPPPVLLSAMRQLHAPAPDSKWLVPVLGLCLQPPLLLQAAPPQLQLLPQGSMRCTLALWLQAQQHCSRGLSLLRDGWHGEAPGMPWPCTLQLLSEVAAALAALHALQPPVAHGAVHAGAVHLLQEPQLVASEQQQEQEQQQPREEQQQEQQQPAEQEKHLAQLSWLLGSSTDAAVQQQAATAVINLAADNAGRVAVCDAGGLAALVKLLGSSADAAVQQDAALALGRVAACMAATRDTVGVAALVQLLGSSTDAVVQEVAAKALRSVAERSAAGQAAVCDAGGVAALVQQLGSSTHVDMQREITWTLRDMAAGAAGQAAVCDADGVAALVQLLGSSTDAEVQNAAAKALRSVAEGSTAGQAAVCAAGGAAALVQLLGTTIDVDVQREVIWALGDMAEGDAACKAAVCDGGGVAALVQLLCSSTDTILHESVARALGNVAAGDSACKTTVCDAGAVGALVQLLDSSTDTVVYENVARALGNVAEGDTACKAAVCDAGGVEALVRSLLKCSDSWSQLEMLRALGNVCSGSPAGRKRVYAEGGEAMLTQLLKSGNGSVQVEAARALELLASSYDVAAAGPACVTGQRKVVSQVVLARLPCLRRPDSLRSECCSICHDKYKEGPLVASLPCSHQFHQQCITRWLGAFSVACPMCRQDVEEQAQPQLNS
ncbi:hypothetical protein OEZ85_007902 [Tetradesmus obliquus]|uniref:Protein kinase domain-containing protein n=1 Tax=Tetradesmus obliquus TaxID=3088 RepID=A0ABY8THL2_TETOB|nr:hypothetical protein OEZ85_007902 [Tetradesmus obliquus]